MCVGHVMYAHVCGCMGVTVLRPEADVSVSLYLETGSLTKPEAHRLPRLAAR